MNEALEYAVSLHASGKTERALFVYNEIAALHPELPDVLLNIGSALHDLERYSEAVAIYRIAIEKNPAWWQALCNLGNSLMAMDRYNEAIDCYNRCAVINPDFTEALVTRGTALESLGMYEEALASYDNALSLRQDCAEAHWNRGLALLRMGKFLEGWKEYEWRFLKKGYTTQQRSWDCPLWDGRDLHGDLILIHSEQAFGDTLQFIRYAPLVAARGGKVIIECPAPLVSLLAGVDGVRHAIPTGDRCNAAYHIPLLSLPLIFATTPETIPSNTPYLTPMAERIEYWRNRMRRDGVLKAGLAWAGRKMPDPHRTCGIEALAPLAGIQRISYYSLQFGDDWKSEKPIESGFGITDFTAEIVDFADTAALIKNLDVVITIDTSVAHLAGALGKKTMIMVPYTPDWRWMLGRNNSPWYPTARIFRQQRPNEWSDVVREVVTEVDKMAGISAS